MCLDCSSMMWAKLAPWPDCTPEANRQLGRPRVRKPCRVAAPSAHFSDSVTPSRPWTSKPSRRVTAAPDLEPGGVDQAVELVLVAVDDDAPLGDPLDAAPLRVDEVHVGPVERVEVLVVEARTLAERLVPRLQRLGRRRVLDDRVDAVADLLHLAEVGLLDDLRRLARSELAPERRGASRIPPSRSVQPSCTRSSSKGSPEMTAVKLSIRSRCQPGRRLSTQASSVGRSLRTATTDGVRWKTYSSSAARPRWGTHWMAVAPVPMMPTRLSARPGRPSSAAPV